MQIPFRTITGGRQMTRSIRLAVLALASLGVLAFAGSAFAAYTTPTLKVTQVGPKTTISVTQAQTDDATAAANIYAPAGTTATLGQAPGTTLGTVTAQVTALALGGALLPLTGEIKVAPPGAVAAASQQACIQAATPAATWLMVLQAAGQTLNVPMYVVTTTGTETGLGPVKIVVCLPPPDVPVDKGGATFGAKLFNAEFSVSGVFNPLAAGAWVAIWTPYTALIGQVNAAASVATPAAIAPGALTAKAAKSGLVKTKVSGQVTQGGQGFGGATVEIWAGLTKGGLKKVAKTSTKADGSYTFTYGKRAVFFRTRTVVAGRAAAPVCALFAGKLPVPCVNPTVNGFTALSAIARRA
jgi:hypothetical protein